jgi:hypothetical protein
VNQRILACDLDGVIFEFNRAYITWLNNKFKCQIPMPSDTYPDTWNYPEDGNYVTKEQTGEFWGWAADKGNYVFWRFLPAYPGAREFLRYANQKFHEIHFVTSRPGKDVKMATTEALQMMGIPSPLVHIADFKPPILKDIGATDFLDDRDKNFDDALAWQLQTSANLWMLDRPWNRHYQHKHVTRIVDPMEML